MKYSFKLSLILLFIIYTNSSLHKLLQNDGEKFCDAQQEMLIRRIYELNPHCKGDRYNILYCIQNKDGDGVIRVIVVVYSNDNYIKNSFGFIIRYGLFIDFQCNHLNHNDSIQANDIFQNLVRQIK